MTAAENTSRPLPCNPEAEQRLLGAILINNKVYHRVVQLVRCEDFGNALHSRIFVEAGKLITEGRRADPVLLKGHFDHDDALKSNGGATYLVTLAASAALITHPEDYAREVHDLAAKRQMIAVCEDTIEAAFRADPAWPAERLIERHTARLANANGLTSWELPQCTSLGDWLERDLPAPDFLLGDVLSTTSRMELVGRTGLGKTNFAMAMAMATAKGDPFLHWKGSKAPRRVLFIDGEMSNRQFKQRLEDAARRAGSGPATFHALCRDDCPKMEPLDTEAGQRFIDRFVESIGGVDLIIFDNIDALTTDDEDFGVQSWGRTLPWIRDLTRRAIGQLWLHHTGQDEKRGYGTKKREWQLDAVAVMEEVTRPGSDIAFSLKFKKNRERTPDNRSDFEEAVITLAGDAWVSDRGGDIGGTPKKKKLNEAAVVGLKILRNCVADHPVEIPPSREVPAGVTGVTIDLWRRSLECSGVINPKGNPREQHKRIIVTLQAHEIIRVWAEYVWLSQDVTRRHT